MVTRLSGGLTPANGADPRTFPAIWNSTAVDIETAEADIDVLQASVTANGTAVTALQGSAVALGSAVLSQGSAIAALEDFNPVQFGTAVPSEGQVLAFSTAVAAYVPEDLDAGGKILQVVSTTKTNTQAIATQTYTDISDLSLSITPESASSKILISFSVSGVGQNAACNGVIRLVQNSTQIFIGDAAGSRVRATTGIAVGAFGDVLGSATGVFLDSPNTTSSVTYKLQGRRNSTSGSFFVNRTAVDADSAIYARSISSITLMEVAG